MPGTSSRTPTATVAVVAWNRLDMTRRCLESLLDTKRPWWRLAAADNGSTDGTREFLEDLRRRGALDFFAPLRSNMGVAAAQNLLWEAVPAGHYVKIDNDIVAEHPDWLDALVQAASPGNGVGMAAYRLCPWHGGEPVVLPDGSPFLKGTTCGGGAACIPAEAHARLGFWNEDYAPYGYEDDEYGWRANLAGLLAGYVPEARVSTLDAKGGEELRTDGYARTKLAATRTDRARTAWFVNLFLFQHGLRPLRVERRHVSVPPETEGGFWRLRTNPDYAPVIAMMRAAAESENFRQWFARERDRKDPEIIPG